MVRLLRDHNLDLPSPQMGAVGARGVRLVAGHGARSAVRTSDRPAHPHPGQHGGKLRAVGTLLSKGTKSQNARTKPRGRACTPAGGGGVGGGGLGRSRGGLVVASGGPSGVDSGGGVVWGWSDVGGWEVEGAGAVQCVPPPGPWGPQTGRLAMTTTPGPVCSSAGSRSSATGCSPACSIRSTSCSGRHLCVVQRTGTPP